MKAAIQVGAQAEAEGGINAARHRARRRLTGTKLRRRTVAIVATATRPPRLHGGRGTCGPLGRRSTRIGGPSAKPTRWFFLVVDVPGAI